MIRWRLSTRLAERTSLRVEGSLEAGHLALDDVLDLVRQLRLDVLLESAKQERSEDFVQAADDQDGLFLVQLNLEAREEQVS